MSLVWSFYGTLQPILMISQSIQKHATWENKDSFETWYKTLLSNCEYHFSSKSLILVALQITNYSTWNSTAWNSTVSTFVIFEYRTYPSTYTKVGNFYLTLVFLFFVRLFIFMPILWVSGIVLNLSFICLEILLYD